MSKLIIIDTISHMLQRYNTCGDWRFGSKPFVNTLKIRVSDTGDDKMNFLIGLHEYIEAMLCHFHGVKEADVDAYDFADPNGTAGSSDMDADTAAPYHKEHCTALSIEWLISQQIGVDWKEYTKKVESMSRARETKEDAAV